MVSWLSEEKAAASRTAELIDFLQDVALGKRTATMRQLEKATTESISISGCRAGLTTRPFEATADLVHLSAGKGHEVVWWISLTPGEPHRPRHGAAFSASELWPGPSRRISVAGSVHGPSDDAGIPVSLPGLPFRPHLDEQ